MVALVLWSPPAPPPAAAAPEPDFDAPPPFEAPELPSIPELPKFEIPEGFELPKFELPADLPNPFASLNPFSGAPNPFAAPQIADFSFGSLLVLKTSELDEILRLVQKDN